MVLFLNFKHKKNPIAKKREFSTNKKIKALKKIIFQSKTRKKNKSKIKTLQTQKNIH